MRDEGTGTSILLETERLFLREMDRNDYDALYRVLADTEIMRHYPYTFDEERVRAWIERNMELYRVNGFGLPLPLYRLAGGRAHAAGYG